MTLLFAKVFGIYFVAVATVLVFNPSAMRYWLDYVFEDPRRGLTGGIIGILFGAFIIAEHNIWVTDWRLFITLIGYWSIIKGVGFLGFPSFIKAFEKLRRLGEQNLRVIGLFWALVGCFFLYQGFLVT